MTSRCNVFLLTTNALVVASTAFLMPASAGAEEDTYASGALYYTGKSIQCDGVTDAGPALAAADAAAKNFNSTLVLPPGTCRILTGFKITTPHTRWRGQGPIGTTILVDNAVSTVTSTAGLVAASDFDNVTDFDLDNITFTGAGANSTNTSARVVLDTPTYVKLRRTTFQNFGISAYATGSISGNTLSLTSLFSGTVAVGELVGDQGGVVAANTAITAINASNPPTCSASTPCTYTVNGSPQTVASEPLHLATYIQGLLVNGGSYYDLDSTDSFLFNSGDGLAFSGNSQHVQLDGVTFTANGDSAYVCTSEGSDFHSRNSNITAPAGSFAPAIVYDRCTDWSVTDDHLVGGGPTLGQGVRVSRYYDNVAVNSRFSIKGVDVSNFGNCISVEQSAATQGTKGSAPFGGSFAVTSNTVNGCGVGIDIQDSENGAVTNNTVIGSSGDAIQVESTLPTPHNTGSLVVAGNTIIGGAYGIHQFIGPNGYNLTPSVFANNLFSGTFTSSKVSYVAGMALTGVADNPPEPCVAYTPTISATGTAPSASSVADACYIKSNGMVFVKANVSVTGGSGGLNITLPTPGLGVAYPSTGQAGVGGRSGNAATPLSVAVIAGSSSTFITTPTGTYPAGSSATIISISGWYATQ